MGIHCFLNFGIFAIFILGIWDIKDMGYWDPPSRPSFLDLKISFAFANKIDPDYLSHHVCGKIFATMLLHALFPLI